MPQGISEERFNFLEDNLKDRETTAQSLSSQEISIFGNSSLLFGWRENIKLCIILFHLPNDMNSKQYYQI